MAPRRQPLPDGSLVDWDEIKDDHQWRALLLGNGLSVNIWGAFGYSSLFDEARRLRSGGLTADDLALFRGLRTQNFEVVLGDLNTAVRVAECLAEDCARLLDRYQSVQAALGEAIRAVHVPWSLVPGETLAAIQDDLLRYQWVFTTSYDLLVYWAMGYDDDYRGLVDTFWGSNGRFDPNDADVRQGSIPVYFLHGAMHLLAEGAGTTRKRHKSSIRNLLEQFGQPIARDPRARPLLVTEGSWRHKLQAIDANPYLAHVFEQLRSCDGPLVVFGSRLGEQDRHLTDALSVHSERPVAVSMMPRSRRELRERQGDIYGRVATTPLLFFDATTYPLGKTSLAVPRW